MVEMLFPQFRGDATLGTMREATEHVFYCKSSQVR
jgi:hypothetical protein